MDNYALRSFYKSQDSSVFNSESIFLYRKDVDFYSNLYVSKFNNGGWNSTELKSPYSCLYSNTSLFVKDYNGNASHIIFTSRAENDNDTVFITKIENHEDCVVFPDAQPLSFITNMAMVIASATLVNGVIFISFVDENTHRAYTVVLDSETYEQLSPVELIDETLSSRYFDEMLNQMTGSIAQFSDDSSGCFLQLSNDSENISVFKLVFDVTSGLSCVKLFVITEDNIGTFSGLYDKSKSVLITCYCQFDSSSKNWNVNGIAKKVFSKTGAAQQVSYSAQHLSSSPGIYYRPQVLRMGDGYSVSWEGVSTLHFKEFDDQINMTAPEVYYRANKPGNHKVVYIDEKYFVGYQSDCSEPRFVGLGYKNDEVKSIYN